jgi:dihydroorotase
LCIDGPVYDQVTTLSKFLALGMRLRDVIAASTVNAAQALKRLDLGTLKPGGVGDASILSLDQGEFRLEDVVGEVVTSGERLFAQGVVIGGRWWHP